MLGMTPGQALLNASLPIMYDSALWHGHLQIAKIASVVGITAEQALSSTGLLPFKFVDAV